MDKDSTDKIIIDTSKDHKRVLKSGEITEYGLVNGNYTNDITFTDIFYSKKNIVEIYFDYNTVISGSTLTKFNDTGFNFELSDGGGDKLKIRADAGSGVPPTPSNYKVYYIIYTGTYA